MRKDHAQDLRNKIEILSCFVVVVVVVVLLNCSLHQWY